MDQEMECMCQQCGMSVYFAEDMISFEDPANVEVKLLSSLLVCENCGGPLVLIGKVG